MTNHDCLPILMLLFVMLYIVLAYIMLFAALSNAVCLHNAYFLPKIFEMLFVFMILLGLLSVACLVQILLCIMHSAFNLLFFPNSMFKPFSSMNGLCALWSSSTYK